jgi:hypothetical protein
MPTVKSSRPATTSVKKHFNRHGGRYFCGVAAAGAVTCLIGLVSNIGSGLQRMQEEHKQVEAQVAQAEEDRRAAVKAAYERGDTTIAFESGDIYRILANRGPAGDVIVTTHKATGVSPDGQITGIETVPRITIKITPPAPSAPGPG